MHIVPHEHSPVLRRVGTFVDLLGDDLAKPRLLGEPLAGEPGDGVPADLDGARLAADVDLAGRHDVGRLAEPEVVLQVELLLQQLVLALLQSFLSKEGAAPAVSSDTFIQKESSSLAYRYSSILLRIGCCGAWHPIWKMQCGDGFGLGGGTQSVRYCRSAMYKEYGGEI